MAIKWLDMEYSRYGGHSTEPFASYSNKNKSSRLYINSKASKEYDFTNYNYARIGVDKENKLLYVKGLDEREEGCVVIHNGGGSDNHSKSISINSLMDIIQEISQQEKDTSKRYKCDYEENLGAIIVDFKETI